MENQSGNLANSPEMTAQKANNKNHSKTAKSSEAKHRSRVVISAVLCLSTIFIAGWLAKPRTEGSAPTPEGDNEIISLQEDARKNQVTDDKTKSADSTELVEGFNTKPSVPATSDQKLNLLVLSGHRADWAVNVPANALQANVISGFALAQEHLQSDEQYAAMVRVVDAKNHQLLQTFMKKGSKRWNEVSMDLLPSKGRSLLVEFSEIEIKPNKAALVFQHPELHLVLPKGSKHS